MVTKCAFYPFVEHHVITWIITDINNHSLTTGNWSMLGNAVFGGHVWSPMRLLGNRVQEKLRWHLFKSHTMYNCSGTLKSLKYSRKLILYRNAYSLIGISLFLYVEQY